MYISHRLQFKSRAKVGCLVNIYSSPSPNGADVTKTGADVPFTVESGVKELVGAADPFYFQEDNSSNLLDFVRVKTGYLRVIESTPGDLDDLIPISIWSHYVEVYYGSQRVFTGYLKCEEFSGGWVACPRTVSLPVVSPLGLMDSKSFSIPTNPNWVTLGSLLKEVMDGLNGYSSTAVNEKRAGWQNVYWPGDDYAPWNCLMNTLQVCPYNSEFDHMSQASELYSTRDYGYFIRGVCACFGWMVHDSPDGLVFVDISKTESSWYSQIGVGDLATAESGKTRATYFGRSFEYYFQNRDAQAEWSLVRPPRSVSLSVGGEPVNSASLDTNHTIRNGTGTYPPIPSSYTMGLGAFELQGVGNEVTSDVMGSSLALNGYGQIENAGLYCMALSVYNKNTDREMNYNEGWFLKYSAQWAKTVKLLGFHYTGKVKTYGAGMLKIKMERGDSLLTMMQTGYSSFKMIVRIHSGDKYYDPEDRDWVNEVRGWKITIDGNTGKVVPNNSIGQGWASFAQPFSDADGLLFYSNGGVKDGMDIEFYIDPADMTMTDGHYLRFADVSVVNPDENEEDYYYNAYKKSYRVAGSSHGRGEETVDVNFQNYPYSVGSNSFVDAQGITDGTVPNMDYMIYPLYVLTSRVRQIRDNGQPDYYMRTYRYWKTGWRWKMLGLWMKLWDDEWTAMIARSETWNVT